MHRHPIINLIQETNYLPKMPKTFGEILNMLLEPCEFNMDECIEKLYKHPKLESTLIQIINENSKLNREILTLKDAVLYLGAKNTKIIAIAHMTKLLLPNRKESTKIFNNEAYWKHCIGTSIVSYMIADETDLCDKDKLFTYGLIHDIGVTVLKICLPDYLDKIYELQLKGLHQIAAEKVVLNGLTHTEIGVWICREWGLPEEIVDVVGYHHSPFIDNPFSNEVKIVHLADSISTNYYEKLLGNESTFIYSDRIRQELKLSKEFIEDLAEKLPKEVSNVNRIIDFRF